MPTGYTAGIANGMTFKEFVMGCARAMGALVTMRDEPMNAEIPFKFEPSNYHHEEGSKAADRLQSLIRMTKTQVEEEAVSAYRSELEDVARIKKERQELKTKYQAIYTQVLDWVPPSKDHVSFKEFMLRQLGDSLVHDCDTSYYDRPIVQKSGEEWRSEQIEKAKWSIGYHKESHNKELKRVEERNRWLKQLRDSLS